MENENSTIVADYRERLRRWMKAKKEHPNHPYPEPDNSHIKNRWLAEQVRKQVLLEIYG